MRKFERVLCPVDFSEFSARAYDYAYSLARHYKGKLFLEHVIEPLTLAYPDAGFPESIVKIDDEFRSDASKRLREFAPLHARNGLRTEYIVQEGVITDALLGSAASLAIDLIVMGTHGRQGLDRLAMGSVTEKVLRKANCPVLVVRKPAHDFVSPDSPREQETVRLRKILYCSDFSDYSLSALECAVSLAMEYNAELTLFHVLEDAPSSADLPAVIASMTRRLEKAIPCDAQNWCKVKSTVRVGKPYQEIIQLAMKSKTDLAVMGVRGGNALDMAIFGSTTHRVIQLGSCPVLAVHAGG